MIILVAVVVIVNVAMLMGREERDTLLTKVWKNVLGFAVCLNMDLPPSGKIATIMNK